MGIQFSTWPRLMKRQTACAYVDMSAAEFERELRKNGGNLPYFRIPPKNPPETYQIDSAVTENFSLAISGGR